MKRKWNRKKILDATKWLKDGICVVTSIGIETLIYIHIFIFLNRKLFLEGVQQSGLFINQTNKGNIVV